MASNISSGTSMATANMKPAANEAIDALWGQNVGDFLGALRAKPIAYKFTHRDTGTVNVGLTTTGDQVLDKAYTGAVFPRWAGHNQLQATMICDITHTCVTEAGGGNGLNIFGTVRAYVIGDVSTATLAATTYSFTAAGVSKNVVFSFGSNLDLAGVANVGSGISLYVEFSGSNYNNPGAPSAIHNNGIQFYVAPFSRFQTTWA